MSIDKANCKYRI